MAIVLPASGIASGVQAPTKKVASGGGSGVDVLPLEYIAVNPTSGMTYLKPDALGYAAAFDASTKVTTFNMEELASGNAKYSMAGAGQEWPRHYAALVDSAGTAMTTADSFIMAIRFSLYDTTVPSSADLRLGVGLCLDPDALTAGDFDGYGITLRSQSAYRRVGRGIWDTSSGSLTSTTANGTTLAYGQIVRSARKNPVVLAYGETAGQVPNNGYQDATSSVELAADSAWHLWVGVSPFGSTGTVAASQSFAAKIEYQIIRLR